MGTMDEARAQLRESITQARPGDHVASVADLSAAVGGLSTGATVTVLGEAMRDGWITSTRGPNGGYWRTDRPVLNGSLAAALAALTASLQATLQAITAVEKAIA